MSSLVVASHLRQILRDKGLKQRAVAAKAGISEKRLSAMLHGKAVIRADEIIRLRAVLDVTFNELFGFDEQKGGRNETETK